MVVVAHMTGALSRKNEDRVKFKYTPGSVLMISGVLYMNKMASLSLLLCKLCSKTKI